MYESEDASKNENIDMIYSPIKEASYASENIPETILYEISSSKLLLVSLIVLLFTLIILALTPTSSQQYTYETQETTNMSTNAFRIIATFSIMFIALLVVTTIYSNKQYIQDGISMLLKTDYATIKHEEVISMFNPFFVSNFAKGLFNETSIAKEWNIVDFAKGLFNNNRITKIIKINEDENNNEKTVTESTQHETSPSSLRSKTETTPNEVDGSSSNDQDKRVFHIKNKQKDYNYNEARAVCRAFGAELATPMQVYKAYEDGESWCTHGWSEGQYALFPAQEKDVESNEKCGKVGLNGSFRLDNETYGINCYGKVPISDMFSVNK